MMQGKIYHMKNPLLVSARNAVMKYTNIPGNDLKKFMITMLMMKCRFI